jgi:hypothetical protein
LLGGKAVMSDTVGGAGQEPQLPHAPERLCPLCKVAMRLDRQRPSPPNATLLIYHCDSCQQELVVADVRPANN